MNTLRVKWHKPRPKKKNDKESIYNNIKWKSLSKRLRIENSQCNECKHTFYDESQLDVDHIVPVSKGGAMYDERNLQVLCKRCHSYKSHKKEQYKGSVNKTKYGELFPAKAVGGKNP